MQYLFIKRNHYLAKNHAKQNTHTIYMSDIVRFKFYSQSTFSDKTVLVEVTFTQCETENKYIN